MDDLLIQRRMRMPVVTGVPTSPEAVRSSQPQTGTSFREVLEQEAFLFQTCRRQSGRTGD